MDTARRPPDRPPTVSSHQNTSSRVGTGWGGGRPAYASSMGIFDKARDALAEHADTIDPLVERVAAEADQRTGGTHASSIDRGADLAKDKLADLARRETAQGPGRPA